MCYIVIVLWPLSHHIVTSAPKFFLTQFLTSFLGTFSPLLSSSPHHINERSIKWLDPLILSLVCKYDMTDYYWSWVKTNLILTLHKIFSFDKVLQFYNLIQYTVLSKSWKLCRNRLGKNPTQGYFGSTRPTGQLFAKPIQGNFCLTQLYLAQIDMILKKNWT